ncbi:MAG: ABC transporter ATP-binding protein [Castellaniella sp.]
MTSTLLQTEQLSKRFGGVSAVNDVSLTFQEGQVHVIIGPNGAGKTTFFHLLTGFYPASAGCILFKGTDITRLPPAERVKLGIARSYQRTNIFAHLSVRENLRLAASRSFGNHWSLRPGNVPCEVSRLVQDTLDLLGLTAIASQVTDTLPYGVQRLVDIGIAICCRPQILLLDEPTSGLSASELHETVGVLKSIRNRFTIVLIEHNMELVVELADIISVLNFGELLANGSPEVISANQAVQEAYFGKRRRAVA